MDLSGVFHSRTAHVVVVWLMADPAIEAAKRARDIEPDLKQPDKFGEMVDAAREMARSVRKLHKREGGSTPTGEYADMCYECQDYWPCATARLVYSTEELEQ